MHFAHASRPRMIWLMTIEMSAPARPAPTVAKTAGRRRSPGAIVHLAAVVAGAVAGAGFWDDEPVPVHRDRPGRPRAGGDPGVPWAAGRRVGRLPQGNGPPLRAGRRRRGGGAGPTAGQH